MIYAYQSPEALGRKIRELGCAAVLAQSRAWQDVLVQAVAETGAVGVAIDQDGQQVVAGTRVDPGAGHRVAGEKRGVFLLTSGTTGPAKLRHTDFELVKTSMVLQSTVHPFGAAPAAAPAMHNAAFGNIAGLYTWLPHVVADRPVVMREKFDLDEYLDYIRTYRPPSAGMPPAAYRQLVDRDEPAETFDGINYMGAGACAMDPDLQRAVETRYGVRILHAFGATEFGGVIAKTTPEDLEAFGSEKSYSVGRPVAGVRLRIVDPETEAPLGPDKPGVLHVKVARIGPDWMATSDLCRLDADGFLWYVGRNDGVIVRGGFKVDPEAVRAALMQHPAIADAIVTGAPDRRLGEAPVVAYVARPGAASPAIDELKDHLRARLPATFLPTAYRQVAALPLTPTNKPNLAAVRAMFVAESP